MSERACLFSCVCVGCVYGCVCVCVGVWVWGGGSNIESCVGDGEFESVPRRFSWRLRVHMHLSLCAWVTVCVLTRSRDSLTASP